MVRTWRRLPAGEERRAVQRRARCGTRAAAPAPTRRRSSGPRFCQMRAGPPPVRGRGRAPPDGRRAPRSPRGRSASRRPPASCRHSRGVAGEVRRDEVGEVAHRREARVDLAARRASASAKARRRSARPTPTSATVGARISPRSSTRQRRDRRIEGVRRRVRPAVRADVLRAAEQRAGTWRPARRGRSAPGAGSRRPGASEPALAVPALGEIGEQAADRGRQPQPPGEHLRHLAERGEVWLAGHRCPWQAPGDLRGTDGRGRSGSGRERIRPVRISRCDPNITGAKCVVMSPAKSSAVTSASAVHPA